MMLAFLVLKFKNREMLLIALPIRIFPCNMVIVLVDSSIHKNKKLVYIETKKGNSFKVTFLRVPETGFEPAHPFEYHHLKVACLPISTSGQTANVYH